MQEPVQEQQFAKYGGEDQFPQTHFAADSIPPDQLNIGKKKKKVKKKKTMVFKEEDQHPEVGDETEETDMEEADRLKRVQEDFRKREVALKEAA